MNSLQLANKEKSCNKWFFDFSQNNPTIKIDSKEGYSGVITQIFPNLYVWVCKDGDNHVIIKGRSESLLEARDICLLMIGPPQTTSMAA
jgi:hypothetical protein